MIIFIDNNFRYLEEDRKEIVEMRMQQQDLLKGFRFKQYVQLIFIWRKVKWCSVFKRWLFYPLLSSEEKILADRVAQKFLSRNTALSSQKIRFLEKKEEEKYINLKKTNINMEIKTRKLNFHTHFLYPWFYPFAFSEGSLFLSIKTIVLKSSNNLSYFKRAQYFVKNK